MDERLHKRLYIAQCLLLGLPALVAGGGVAGFGIYTFLIRHGLMRGDEGAVLFLWASAGVAGLLAWLWLSIRYLRRGALACGTPPVFPGSAWRWAPWRRWP